MKKLSLVLALAGVLAAPTARAAFDGKVNISDAPGLGTSSGGAFWIDITQVNTPIMGMVQGQGNPFLSFCIETAEYITVPGNGYDANVSAGAIAGGTGGNPDPISKATAWLYSQFRAGTLSAATANAFQMNDAGGNALQAAIWWLEQEANGANNYLVTAAVAATGAGTAANAQTINANGAYGVWVLNLYNGPANGGPPDYRNQDMLAMVPEPTTVLAGALLLLPFAASTLRRVRRNRTA